MSTLADELEHIICGGHMPPSTRVALAAEFVQAHGEIIVAALRSTDALAVPREPTQAMINAIGEEILKWDGHWDDKARKLWQIMYDAAQGARSKP